MTLSPAPLDRRVATAHGLRLHVRDWRPASSTGPAVVCLPGLARTLEDFTELAEHLSSEAGGRRRVVAISARGRGRSDRDPNPARYDVRTETADVVQVLDALGLAHGAVVGTSRGGLQTMALAAVRPSFLRAVVLNDIGPVIDARGLIRIRSYLAKAETPADWPDARRAVERLFSQMFPTLGPTDWDRIARRTWREGQGGLEPAYDPALTATFAGLDLEAPLPPLWGLFDALAGVPLMVLRGALSDILSAETVAEMARRRPDLKVLEVPGQGHAPQLADAATLDAIAAFIGDLP